MPLPDHEVPIEAPGRLKAAWGVLRGDRVVPDQIRAEWAEYQVIFSDLLTRQSALLARQAKEEKRRLDRLASVQAPEASTPAPHQGGKASLRRRAALQKGLGGHISHLEGKSA
jgi:hypothetical protein